MSDYGGFRQIIEEARKLDREQRGLPPVACPLCGTPLEYNEKRGLLNCPAGHYRIAGRPKEAR